MILPEVEPPEVVSERIEPKVPDSEVMLSALWLAFVLFHGDKGLQVTVPLFSNPVFADIDSSTKKLFVF